MRGLTWRFITVLGTVLFSIYLLLPTVLKFHYGKQVSKVAKADDPWYFSVLPSEVLKLGLDLMGGLHLVLGIDFDEVQKDSMVKLKGQLKDLMQQNKLDGVTFEVTNDGLITGTFTDEAKWKAVDRMIGKDLGQYIDFVEQKGNQVKLRMTALRESEVRRQAIDQSLETLRNRIDEFGIAEPIISRQGDDKILVQFPGVQETGRLKEIISRTAKLSFQVVRTGPEEPNGSNGSPPEAQLRTWVQEFETAKKVKPDPMQPMSNYVRQINAFLANKLPAGTEILFHKVTNVNTKEVDYVPYLLDREALVTGEDLEDAFVGFSQEGDAIVNFHLQPLGASKFEKATGDNVGKFMAIVLDSNVHSSPRIKQKIGGGRAMIEMSGNGRGRDEIANDARDTSLVLRSGALPARLLFLEERVIGPSLGADAIKAGSYSLIFGLGLVFLFMGLYYRGSGVVASGALLLNGVFVLACMAAFEGTLTLPGLAGLTLTLGMAVDANVLIFEHMREELRLGKSVASSISEGYHRAFSAILDGHSTAILAGIVLLSFGYGPIRGFAVTMLIGLIASMYTSVFVTRLFFDWFFISKNRKTISL